MQGGWQSRSGSSLVVCVERSDGFWPRRWRSFHVCDTSKPREACGTVLVFSPLLLRRVRDAIVFYSNLVWLFINRGH